MRRTPAESRYQVMMFAVLTWVFFLMLFLLFFRGRQSWGGLSSLLWSLVKLQKGKKWLLYCIISFLLYFKWPFGTLHHMILLSFWIVCIVILNIFFIHIIRSGSTCGSVLRRKQLIVKMSPLVAHDYTFIISNLYIPLRHFWDIGILCSDTL